MASKDFTSQEWSILQKAILWVFYAIARIDGTVDESEWNALLAAFKGEHDLFITNELACELLRSINKNSEAILKEFEKDELGIPMGLKAAAELVEKKLDKKSATDFKRSLLYLGTVFAKASDEIPGETTGSRISAEERAAILTVAAIMRLDLQDLMI